MAIIFNGTNIPTNGDNMVYNGVKLTNVIYNNVEVWKKETNKVITLANVTGNKDRAQMFPGDFYNSGCILLYNNIDTSKYKGITISIYYYIAEAEFRGMDSYVGLCAYQGTSMIDYLSIVHAWCDWSVPHNPYSTSIENTGSLTSRTFLWDDKISSGTINLYAGPTEALSVGNGDGSGYMFGSYKYSFLSNATLLAK